MSEQAVEKTRQMPKHGEFCWNELATTNREDCQKFYAELFGWKFKENKPAENDSDSSKMIYDEISLDGQNSFGGMYQMGKEFGEMPPNWIPYVAVDDVEAAAQKVVELGGTVCVPPTDIPNTGRFCVISDPTGAKISLITLKSA